MLCSPFLWLLQSVGTILLKQRDLEWCQHPKDFSEEGSWWWIFLCLTCCLSSAPRERVKAALQPPSITQDLPGAAFPSLVALPELELRQAGQWEPSSAPLRPRALHGQSSANNTRKKNISLIVLSRWPEAVRWIFLGLSKKTVCSTYKWYLF